LEERGLLRKRGKSETRVISIAEKMRNFCAHLYGHGEDPKKYGEKNVVGKAP